MRRPRRPRRGRVPHLRVEHPQRARSETAKLIRSSSSPGLAIPPWRAYAHARVPIIRRLRFSTEPRNCALRPGSRAGEHVSVLRGVTLIGSAFGTASSRLFSAARAARTGRRSRKPPQGSQCGQSMIQKSRLENGRSSFGIGLRLLPLDADDCPRASETRTLGFVEFTKLRHRAGVNVHHACFPEASLGYPFVPAAARTVAQRAQRGDLRILCHSPDCRFCR